MLSKLAAITIGDVWYHVWRAFVWVMFIAIVAVLLDIQPSWKVLVLVAASSFIDGLIYGPRKWS